MLVAQPRLTVALTGIVHSASSRALQVAVGTRVEVAEVRHIESMRASCVLLQLHDR